MESADTVQSGDWGGRAGEVRRVLDLRAGVTIPHTPVKITRWVDIIDIIGVFCNFDIIKPLLIVEELQQLKSTMRIPVHTQSPVSWG